ncbi:MAG TPA: hypothetical protein PKC67_00495 [Kiritimatiellia bacterium]|nr:hypothetical protein [Kiritimatiellia bacterium]HMP32800.1 hypothetical protein [Kiritimatiellia bacterium]
MRILASCLCAGLALLLISGCDDNDPDHKPAPGKGALFINNTTASDIQVFINSERFETVQDFDDRAYDLPPGVYRLILDEQGGDRTYRDDIDIIEGRLTVLDVAIEPFDDNFDVEVFFRTP